MAFTYFYRDLQTLEVMIDHMLPSLNGKRTIDIWSAGCAMGPEPYTIALLLKENMGAMDFSRIRILASDIDRTNNYGAILIQGRYPFEELERIPNEHFTRNFTPDPDTKDHFIITEEVRNKVSFKRHDLLTLHPPGRNFSLISCKNVLLHFTDEERINVIRMFYESLVDGGFFLTEQTQKMPAEVADLFEQVVPHAQVYRKLPARY
ncbi:MAG: chemotaxis protein CheR [Methanocalculus sp. MSAO_Arc1]|uniref:CheR family methyltransferase n=1 Tax=Methanocalculus TaxID=71151 RepID=UPI000FF36EF5|nr:MULTISPECIES: CheR family methyltransferase [unclassified Methanocalculus]MCP1661414.1 chemotaxis protein methyltransferase CheR [Methanocalculus sp. AMF5]RQD79691.1 MAG: chemotaxis protein CheR [Methanocalculus sp. MSAO_Arc1]